MGFVSRVKAAMRDAETIREIQSMPRDDRPVIVYAEDDYTWNQLEGYVRALVGTHDQRVVYVTSDPGDPVLDLDEAGLVTRAVTESVPKLIAGIDSPAFVTTMPDLDRFHIKRPQESTCIYVFHSLNSTHASYREGAFDAYDVFLCVGPYHREELTRRFEAVGKGDYTLESTGYYKLDRIRTAAQGYEKRHPEDTTVLVAPSWGADNLLESVGSEVVGSIAATGARTVVRPHPAFFESIYPGGRGIVERLERQFADLPNVVFEHSITSEDSFLEADVMVSDWSGAAAEFALGTDRPVLFLDVPRKVMNPEWEDIGLAPFEERIRSEVGEVLPVSEAGEAGRAITDLLGDHESYPSRMATIRDRELYNVGTAAESGAAAIHRHASAR